MLPPILLLPLTSRRSAQHCVPFEDIDIATLPYLPSLTSVTHLVEAMRLSSSTAQDLRTYWYWFQEFLRRCQSEHQGENINRVISYSLNMVKDLRELGRVPVSWFCPKTRFSILYHGDKQRLGGESSALRKSRSSSTKQPFACFRGMVLLTQIRKAPDATMEATNKLITS